MESLEYGPSPDRAVELPWDEKHSVVEEAINRLGGAYDIASRTLLITSEGLGNCIP